MSSTRFRAANEEYVERNRGADPPAGRSSFRAWGCSWACRELARAVAGQPRRHRRPDDDRRVGRLQQLPGHAGVADDCVRLGDQPRAARTSVVATDARVLETPPAIDDRRRDASAICARGSRAARISLRHLTFRIVLTDRLVLDGSRCDVAAGQTVAIVGQTGSGKSTLLSLLARLHDPPPGTVFIDGIDVREMPLATLRGAIGFVPQEPFLFSDTIAENVAFGADGRVRRCAADAGVAGSAVAGRGDRPPRPGRRWTFPRAIETRIGERGITLSGGQKQRTAIARALYIDPRILVLDDALSAVDTHTEDEILQRLRDVRRGRTTFIVSHRISTVRDADRIVVLDGGRIVEQGTHDELVAAGGSMPTLHRQQLLEDGVGRIMSGPRHARRRRPREGLRRAPDAAASELLAAVLAGGLCWRSQPFWRTRLCSWCRPG